MNKIIVRNKSELEQALKNNKGACIRVEGAYAQTLANKLSLRKKAGKLAVAGGALAILGGLVAAPFTGGASLAGSAAGVATMLTVGTVTLSTGQLAMVLGLVGALGGYAIHKNYHIKVVSDGKSVAVEMSPTK